jgi:ribosomal protein L35AE/L33A
VRNLAPIIPSGPSALAALALLGFAAACSRSPYSPAQCSDGIDNDGDGRTDLEDPGCADPGDDDEGGHGAADADADAEADVDVDEDGAGETADDGTDETGPETDDGGDDVEDDGDTEADSPCTTGCWNGTSCEPGTETNACGTSGAGCLDCDDGRDCTIDSCTAGRCTNPPAAEGAGCSEITGGRCVDGACALVRTGTVAFDAFGTSVALVPDVDGDGVPDCLIGAPGAEANNGRVWVYSGAAAVESHSWPGSAGEGLGASVCGGEDLDGDGYGDLGMGGPDAASYAGLALIVRGGPAFGTPEQLDGLAPYDEFGLALDFGPHASGAGSGPDIAVGAPRCSDPSGPPNTGCVTIFDGSTLALLRTIYGEETGAWFGAAVALGPDVDQVPDGFGDLLVGEPRSNLVGLPGGRSTAGRVHLVSSRTGAVAWTLDGPLPNSQLGSSVSFGGDLDGDGGADAAIGAPFYMLDKGAVWVVDGTNGADLWTPALSEGAADERFGTSVSIGPDATGDGVPDVAVGAPGADSARGRVYLLSGTDGTMVRTFTAEAPGEQLGGSVSLGPDVDGDGLGDVLAGAATAGVSPRGDAVGKAYLFPSRGW